MRSGDEALLFVSSCDPLSVIMAPDSGYHRMTYRMAQVAERMAEMVKDPVCGMMIDEKTAAGKSEYQGQTYYFCATVCKTRFDADPKRYTGGDR